MGQYNANINAAIGGVSIPSGQISVIDDLELEVSPPSITAAQPGSLTTRGSNTAGTVTMTNTTTHGIVDGQRIDLYWSGGQAYGATVGTVAGAAVPFTGAAGTVLPIATTAINVGIPTQRLIALTGDNLSAVVMYAVNRAQVVFASSAPAALLAVTLGTTMTAGGSYNWYTGNGVTNPLAGVTVASVWMSHENTAAASRVAVGLLYH